MRAIIAVLAVAASSVPALAQEDFKTGSITIGGQQFDSDTNSSKYMEYRDIPQGGVLPGLRFAGKKGDFRYDLSAQDVTQKDQVYRLRLESGALRFDADYTGVPHDFGNGGRSILNPLSDDNWRLADTLQSAYQNQILITPGAQVTYPFLSNLVQPALNAAPANVDLKLLRQRGALALTFTPQESRFNLGMTYLHERRSGTRSANGTAFGFGNVVETPEPVRYITQDFAINGALRGDWGSARAGVRFNDFSNSMNTFTWDNPFRITDSTDPSAYQSPGSASKNGPVFGAMALPPDNKATTESVGVSLKLGKRSRLTADLALGQWRQDSDPLLAWTTNTAILTPSGARATTAPLPAATLGGKIDTTSLNAFFTTKLTDALGLAARVRYYDHDNQTPRHELHDGYVRFDAVWEDIPRITVPYGYTNTLLDVFGTYSLGALGLEAGFKHNKMERTFRESDDTSENVFRVAADLRHGIFVFRGIGEFGNRDYSNYDAARSEDASFLEPGAPANQTVLRRPDQAARDLTRVGGQLEIAPGSGKLTFFASYMHTKFAYKQDHVECEDVALFPGQSQFCPGGEQEPLGLVDDKYDTFTAEVGFNPTARINLYGFYTWEDGDVLQTGRQSGSTVDFNPLNVWTSNITSKGDTFGAGADFTLVPDKWSLNLFGRYQNIDGNNSVSLRPGYSTAIYGTNVLLRQCTTTGATPCAIPDFDDTKLTYVSGKVEYHIDRQWTAGAGVGYEEYTLKDSQTGNTLNYMPASFFLQANNRDYKAWIGWLNLRYSF